MDRNKSKVYEGINSYGSFSRVNPVFRAPIAWKFAEAPKGVRVLFTMRKGGVSEPPYKSLNLGFHVGDDPDLVRQNRTALCETYNLDPASITSPRQRHTAVVRFIERDEDVGSGAAAEESVFDPCDGLITTLRNVPILLHFADCLPVVLAVGGRKPAIAVLHAGRKGLVEGVVRNGIAMLMERTGVGAGEIVAALGPAIGPCCYEVGTELAHEFGERFGDEAVMGENIDLAAVAIIDLKGAGVIAWNIHMLDICTACDKDFYSYRRDGVTGRHGAVAWIE